MASSLGVSRGSLRQVLKMLEIMGVVSQRVGDGTYLNTAAPSILAEPMEFLILLDGISFEELMDARLIVEPELAARAATRNSPEMLAELRASIERYQDGRPHPELIEEDLQFHRTIFRMADNRVCSLMFSMVHESLRHLMEITSRIVDAKHTSRMHLRVYTAIKNGDAGEARARMFAHLTNTKGLLSRSNDAQNREAAGKRLSAMGKGSALDGKGSALDLPAGDGKTEVRSQKTE
jgi:GntR family transcriptional repressor for pyruvate dehydrogenase complex